MNTRKSELGRAIEVLQAKKVVNDKPRPTKLADKTLTTVSEAVVGVMVSDLVSLQEANDKRHKPNPLFKLLCALKKVLFSI